MNFEWVMQERGRERRDSFVLAHVFNPILNDKG